MFFLNPLIMEELNAYITECLETECLVRKCLDFFLNLNKLFKNRNFLISITNGYANC